MAKEPAHDEHDHEHHTADPKAATAAVVAAQSGFRRDVEALIEAFRDTDLLVPLAEAIEGAPEGELVEVQESLSIRPHMVIGPDGGAFCVFFTEVEYAESIAVALDWQTSGDDLQLCTIYAGHAFQMALSVIDEVEVRGLVLNPGTDAELVLQREELASIAQGNAIPLVGYVDDIETGPDETLLAEPAEPPPPEFVEALEGVRASVPAIVDFEIRRTFNPDRDREPHLSVSVKLDESDIDRAEVGKRLFEAVEGKVPPPGYVDILFE